MSLTLNELNYVYIHVCASLFLFLHTNTSDANFGHSTNNMEFLWYVAYVEFAESLLANVFLLCNKYVSCNRVNRYSRMKYNNVYCGSWNNFLAGWGGCVRRTRISTTERNYKQFCMLIAWAISSWFVQCAQGQHYYRFKEFSAQTIQQVLLFIRPNSEKKLTLKGNAVETQKLPRTQFLSSGNSLKDIRDIFFWSTMNTSRPPLTSLQSPHRERWILTFY